MNFLSHYYLLPEKDNTDKVVGNLLPDLIRGFTKIYHKELKDNPQLQGSDILEGIHYHMLTDAVFHEHDFFLENCEWIKSNIKTQQLPKNRSFIVAHVMVELIIDQYLMEKESHLAPSFYHSLNDSATQDLNEKLNITLNRQNSSKIISIFKGFTESKYAYILQSDEGLTKALYQIIGKRIGENFESPLWQELVKEARMQMNEGLPTFLKNLKEALKNA